MAAVQKRTRWKRLSHIADQVNQSDLNVNSWSILYPISCSNHMNGMTSGNSTAVKTLGLTSLEVITLLKRKEKPDVDIKSMLKRLYEQNKTSDQVY